MFIIMFRVPSCSQKNDYKMVMVDPPFYFFIFKDQAFENGAFDDCEGASHWELLRE